MMCCRSGLCERRSRATPCWTPLVPASYIMAEPINQAGGLSVVTYLRKGKKRCAAAEREKWERSETNRPADIKVREGEEKVLQIWIGVFPATHGEEHSEAGCPLQSMEGPAQEQVFWGDPCSSQGTLHRERSPCWSS